MSTTDIALVRTQQAAQNLDAMEAHAAKVESAWGKRRPEWALATYRSLSHVLARTITMGGNLSADSRMGLWLQSGMGICTVARTMVQVDPWTEDDPSIGAWPKDTPYIGRFCMAWFADEPGVPAKHCESPIYMGKRTCDDDHDVVVMGMPIPVEWSMHS